MANRDNHYERGFESLLRYQGASWLPVLESERMWAEARPVKNLDFVVTRPDRGPLLIDVKGRRIPSGRRTLENWVTEDDIDGLLYWQGEFPGSEPLLVFVYQLSSECDRRAFVDNFTHGGRHYGCLAIAAALYRRHMRRRSPRWRTVNLRASVFAQCSRPFSRWLREGEPDDAVESPLWLWDWAPATSAE